MSYIDFSKLKKTKLMQGLDGSLFNSTCQTIARVELEKNAVIPMHSHHHEQWTYLLEGQLEFRINNSKKMMKPGMMAFIPPNTPHTAKAITRCMILDCFHPVYHGRGNDSGEE